MSKIVLYSNKHRVDDNRIVELEACAFNAAGFETVVYGKTKNVNADYPGIHLYECKKRSKDCYDQCIKEEADVYIFHDPGLLQCAVKLHHKGKTVMFDAHENYEEKLKSRIPDKYPIIKPFRRILAKIWWMYEKQCINTLDGKLCADRTVMEKYGRNTYLLPNMPSIRFYDNLPERTSDIDTFRLIYVGTLTWDRGIVETIKAIGLCKHQNVEFHVVGETEDEGLKRTIQNAGNTIWHGRIPWMELKNYLVNMDLGIVLLQPKEAFLYYPGENIVKLWEYMSVGLPVLLSDFPGLVELNQKLGFGMTVQPDDPQKIANAIDWLMEHPEARRTMGEQGREWVLKQYNAEHYIQGLLRFVEKYV